MQCHQRRRHSFLCPDIDGSLYLTLTESNNWQARKLLTASRSHGSVRWKNTLPKKPPSDPFLRLYHWAYKRISIGNLYKLETDNESMNVEKMEGDRHQIHVSSSTAQSTSSKHSNAVSRVNYIILSRILSIFRDAQNSLRPPLLEVAMVEQSPIANATDGGTVTVGGMSL